MFKVGDIVKCTNSSGNNILIKGREYTVNYVTVNTVFDMIGVNDDNKTYWYSDRFVLVDIKEIRKQKLKKICLK